MPRASRRKLRKEISEELEDNFAFLVSSLHSPSDIREFLETFLTTEEKTMLTKRLMMHLMLHNGHSSLDIRTVINVSKETVRVHKTVWHASSQTYKIIITKIANREKVKEFWKKVEQFLRPLEYAFDAKTNMKARAKLIFGDYKD